MRVAVIGSGPAAAGVLTSLHKRRPDASVTLFNGGREPEVGSIQNRPPREWSEDEYAQLHSRIKSQFGLTFPPPKTFFGQGLKKYQAGQYAKPFISEFFGGLSRHWSASVFPFVEKDFEGWPIGLKDFKDYYREIADHIGISGQHDALNSYFGEDFVNLPPIEVPESLMRLDKLVNSKPQNGGGYQIISGLNRLAVETRNEAGNSCVYCGECMYGCFRGSIYDATKSINAYQQAGLIKEIINEKVLSVKSRDGAVQIRTPNDTYERYDKVFLCAGCFGTTEIVMRSLGIRQGVTIKDNNSYVFPIFYLGRNSPEIDRSSYISITNTVLGCVPLNDSGCYSHVHISPFADYYWRYYLPVGAWRYFNRAASLLKGKMILAKMYFPTQVSKSYSVSLDIEDRLHVERESYGTSDEHARKVLKQLRKVVSGKGFVLPPVKLVRMSTSSHYVGAFPYSGELVKVSPGGEIMPNLYIADSTVFPESPAQTLTFTIMANAARTVREAVNG